VVLISPAVQLYEGHVRLPYYRPRLCGSGLCREGTRNSPTFSLAAMVYRRGLWNL